MYPVKQSRNKIGIEKNQNRMTSQKKRLSRLLVSKFHCDHQVGTHMCMENLENPQPLSWHLQLHTPVIRSKTASDKSVLF